MLKVSICDDDLEFSESFMKMLTESFGKENMHCNIVCYENGKILLESKEVFDVYFLDVELPQANGLKIAGEIRKKFGRKPELIFVTIHDNAVYDVFEYEAIGFIRKTYIKEDLEKTMSVILRKVLRKSYRYEFKSEGSTIYKYIEEMLYVEVYSHKLILHCIDGDYPIWGSLDELEKKFSQADFIRSHRGFLINPQFIKKIQRQSIILDTPELIAIPLSKYKAAEVKRKYLDYIVNG